MNALLGKKGQAQRLNCLSKANKPQCVFCALCLLPLFSNWSNCGATLIWVSLFLRGFNMDNTTASEPWTYKLWTYSQGFIRCGWYRTFGVYIFVNWISQVWLQEGQWFALIPGVGGQAASARRRAALPMAAQKAATLIFPMLGLKTGRQSHLSLQHIKQVSCIIA